MPRKILINGGWSPDPWPAWDIVFSDYNLMPIMGEARQLGGEKLFCPLPMPGLPDLVNRMSDLEVPI